MAAMATPEGNEVEVIFGSLAALVIAELPIQERTPMGPSAILMAGMPRRSIGADSIQPEPASMVAFSSSVMRLSRSATRWSTGNDAFLYAASVAAGVDVVCEERWGTRAIEKDRRGIAMRRLRGFIVLSGRSHGTG